MSQKPLFQFTPTRCAFAFLIIISQSLFVNRVFFAADQRTETKAHVESGLQLAKTGDLAKAEIELWRAVELAPGDAQSLASLGAVLAMQKKFEESTRIYQRALKLSPGDLTTRRYLAANLWQLHHYPEAKQQLEIILKEKRGDKPTLLLLGMVAENMKDYATAAKLLAAVPEEVRAQPESTAALSRAYYHLGEKEKARSTLDELLTHPAGAEGVLLGAHIADEMQDYDTATKLLASIAPTFPDRSKLGYTLAQVEYHAKRFQDSQRTLLDLIESGITSSRIYNLLGWCYQQQNQPKGAAIALEESIRLDPGEETNYLDLGKILLASRSFSVARELANRMRKAFPNSPRAALLKGSIELKATQFTDAIESYSAAVRLEPANPDAQLGLAEAQSASGMISEATASFESSIKRFPGDARFRLQYALMLLREAETGNASAEKHAEQLLKAAVGLNPSMAEAHYQLGSLALKNSRTAEALTYLERAEKLDSRSIETHFALARVYRRLDRKDEASREINLYEKLKEDGSQSGSAPMAAGATQD